MSKPRISIVTPSFNQAPFIENTLRSVLEQQGDFELEYRVLDGGSTDGTLDILRRYEGRLHWSSGPDKGQVDAINKGLRAARGDIVGWVNSDDVLAPGALAKVAAAFAARPEAEWLHGRCEIIDADDRPIRRWISRYKHARAQRHSLENLLTENYVSQMTTFWRRRVHGEIGYLDESLKLAFDYEFWLRLAKRGAPIYLEDQLASFRWYETSKSGAQYDRQFAEDMAIAGRHLPAGRRAILLRKKLKSAGIVLVYRSLGLFRRMRGA
ncbi:glycosyltransferase family 2 protein [Roseateles violae]|uniref:Glycosyltransferase family 2 protein n=1 Tax=Roseateles violae TaxID=3058042 RepID=A0ABT8DWD0_9BURK|nr:glycosyltransferase family 2 protein [Pelomonas sp. PFR6]MDN3920476.1 glycosyltransferase family 2 protein [Pelomonas sp. PFR6]